MLIHGPASPAFRDTKLTTNMLNKPTLAGGSASSATLLFGCPTQPLLNRLVEFGAGKASLQAVVLRFEILQALRQIDLHPAVLTALPVIGYLGHAQPMDGLAHADTFGKYHLSLTLLRKDLPGFAASSASRSSPLNTPIFHPRRLRSKR